MSYTQVRGCSRATDYTFAISSLGRKVVEDNHKEISPQVRLAGRRSSTKRDVVSPERQTRADIRKPFIGHNELQLKRSCSSGTNALSRGAAESDDLGMRETSCDRSVLECEKPDPGAAPETSDELGGPEQGDCEKGIGEGRSVTHGNHRHTCQVELARRRPASAISHTDCLKGRCGSQGRRFSAVDGTNEAGVVLKWCSVKNPFRRKRTPAASPSLATRSSGLLFTLGTCAQTARVEVSTYPGKLRHCYVVARTSVKIMQTTPLARKLGGKWIRSHRHLTGRHGTFGGQLSRDVKHCWKPKKSLSCNVW